MLSNNVINNIFVNKIYTLPYINKLNNWVVDNEDTNISIINNQYTGIKQLYIYSVKQENSYNSEILNVSDNNILSNISYKEKKFKINHNLFYKYSNIDIYCFTNIPQINDNNKDFFRNSLIISISSRDNIYEELENDSYKDDYQLDYVYSLWKPNFTTNEFELITLSDDENDENSFAFDPFNNYEFYVNNSKYKYYFFQAKCHHENKIKRKYFDILIEDCYIKIILPEETIHQLIFKTKGILINKEIVQAINAPVIICGDDMINIQYRRSLSRDKLFIYGPFC